MLDEILSAHNYPPVVERLLAEALTLTALLGSLLKDPQGQMTLQAQTEGGRDRPARVPTFWAVSSVDTSGTIRSR